MIEKKRPGFNAHKVKAKKNRRRQRRIRQINRAVDFNQFLKRAHRRKPLHAALNITTYGVPKMMQCRDITLRYAPVRETEGEINLGHPPALAGEYIAQAPCRVSKARNPAIRQMREPFKNADRTRGAEPPEHQAESTQLNKNLFTILSARPCACVGRYQDCSYMMYMLRSLRSVLLGCREDV